MNTKNVFEVVANGILMGIFEAYDEQGARDACAVDAGYKSEADMEAQLEQPSDLVATAYFRPSMVAPTKVTRSEYDANVGLQVNPYYRMGPDHELESFKTDRIMLVAAVALSLTSVSACAVIIISWLI